MEITLKDTFLKLIRSYTDDGVLIAELWQEVDQAYSAKTRHYHTLAHLDNLFIELAKVQPMIQNWDAVLFALFYHDAIYDVLKSDNEQQSADLAHARMLQLSVDPETIRCCELIILATKSHERSNHNDVNLFTDADLSILGQPWDAYMTYYKSVRKEYSVYPDMLYCPGRKKVLQHFLSMNRVFKTEHFFEQYEIQARRNIQQELETL